MVMLILRNLVNRLGYVVIIAGLGASPALAQTVLKVPYGATHFAWDAPAPGVNQSPATKHTIVCGTVSVDVPMPATSKAIKDVVPGPGVYTCSLYASNAFGRQVEPNVPFPQFEAGFEPPAALNSRIEVR